MNTEKTIWQIKLMPLDASSAITEYQKHWIENNIFGMGWYKPGITDGEPIKGNTDFIEKLWNGDNAAKKAFNYYQKIKPGDIIITRLKTSKYYAGVAEGEIAYNLDSNPLNNEPRLSWCGRVNKWIKLPNEEELPAEIVGRFSQRHQPTIRPINSPEKLKKLIIAQINPECAEPIEINEDDFCTSLHYTELEDLVATYIYKKHLSDGYMLLPSSCKKSRAKYEFCFVKKGKKPITCQVKSQNNINIEDYTNSDGYSKIYLFCGIWDNNTVNAYRNQYANYTHIDFISKSDLYSLLKSGDTYLKEKLERNHHIIL